MGLWSEEERSGTLEILFSLPLKDVELVLGKFLAAWSFLGFVLSFTFLIPATIFYLGDLDLGITFAGYLGIFLLGGANLVLGSFVSSLTKDQISSYLLGLILCLFFFLLGYRPLLQFLGTGQISFFLFPNILNRFVSESWMEERFSFFSALFFYLYI